MSEWELLYTEAQIKQEVASVVRMLDTSLHTSRVLPYVIGIAEGGLRLADLVNQEFNKRLAMSLRGNISVSSYKGTEKGDVIISPCTFLDFLPHKPSFAFILVDDICDTGHTLRAVTNDIKARFEASIYSIVAVHRLVDKQVFTPSHPLFSYGGSAFLCGFGMDDGSGDPVKEQAARDLKYIAKKRA